MKYFLKQHWRIVLIILLLLLCLATFFFLKPFLTLEKTLIILIGILAIISFVLSSISFVRKQKSQKDTEKTRFIKREDTKRNRLSLVTLIAIVFIAVTIYAWRPWESLELADKYVILMDLIMVLMAFAGIIGFLTHKLIDKSIKATAEKEWKKERNLSKADTFIALGYLHMRLYNTVYQERTEPEDTDGKAKEQIDSALSKAQKAIEYLKNIEEEECFREIFLAKNNFVYYSARQWNYYKYHRNSKGEVEERDGASFKGYIEQIKKAEKYRADKRIAEGYVNYLKNKKASGMYPELSENFENTFVWVEKIFSINPEIKIEP